MGVCSRSGGARCTPRIVEALERLYAGAGGRAGRSAGAPCPAGRGVGQGRGLLPAGGDKAMARSAYREAVGYFEQALEALPHLPETRDTREQAIDLRLALRMALCCRSATRGVSSTLCAKPRPSPRPWTIPQRLGRVSCLSVHRLSRLMGDV